MNYHCWQNAKTNVKNDEAIMWPKLRRSTNHDRSQIRRIARSRISQIPVDLAGYSEETDVPSVSLDEIDYPRLGDNITKRKHSSVEYNQLAIVDNFADRAERRLRIPRSTDLIRVNLQTTLESQNWPNPLLANQSTKRTIDICKLNVNMSVASPLARWLLIKSKRRALHIEKKKRPSRLKSLIMYERMIRKRANANFRQIRKVSLNTGSKEDISVINFDSLRINVAPTDDPELLKKMSALSCLSMNYRDTREISVADDDVIFQPDLHQQMENMSIRAKKDSVLGCNDENNDYMARNDETIDAVTIKATESLKICHETVEIAENISLKETEISRRVKFTKKFREYCTNTVTSDLSKYLDDFLAEISRLQKKMYERDSVKGKSRRRYYAGIKEVQKHIDLKKIKFVVVATDLEKVEIEGGLDDTLGKLVGTCKRYEIPYCFGLGRRKLGYYTHGRGLVSCIGIANYSGAEEKLKNVLLEVVEAKNNFTRQMSDEAKIIDVEKYLPKEELLLSEIINAYLRIIASNG